MILKDPEKMVLGVAAFLVGVFMFVVFRLGVSTLAVLLGVFKSCAGVLILTVVAEIAELLPLPDWLMAAGMADAIATEEISELRVFGKEVGKELAEPPFVVFASSAITELGFVEAGV